MSTITSMFEAIEFIESNLKADVAIADVAGAVAHSLYHFCRTFNRIVHHTPYDYLMRRRLSESARELVQTNKKIIDIAFDYRFNHPETYSRAFKRLFGLLPYQWRKQGRVDKRLLMPRLTLAHLQHINTGSFLTPVPVELAAIQLAGMMTLTNEERHGISQLWQILEQELPAIKSRTQPAKYYGVASYPKNWEQRGFLYMAAVEVTRPGSIPYLLAGKTIPAGQYARFIHHGPDRDLPLTLDYIYHTWLPKSGRELSCPLELEEYGQELPGDDRVESERKIYVPMG
jgi:AraC family transcriptional regulator